MAFFRHPRFFPGFPKAHGVFGLKILKNKILGHRDSSSKMAFFPIAKNTKNIPWFSQGTRNPVFGSP